MNTLGNEIPIATRLISRERSNNREYSAKPQVCWIRRSRPVMAGVGSRPLGGLSLYLSAAEHSLCGRSAAPRARGRRCFDSAGSCLRSIDAVGKFVFAGRLAADRGGRGHRVNSY